MKAQLYHFLEESDSFAANVFKFAIIVLIILSSTAALIQILDPVLLADYELQIQQFEYIALGIFTFELLLRFIAAPSLKQFFNRSITWIDLLSIVPFYFGIQNSVFLRLFRVLRVARVSRQSISDFFDNPESKLAVTVQFVIAVLIISSAGLALTQLIKPEWVAHYSQVIFHFETTVLAIFTIEFLIRLFATRSVSEFIKQPSNWIDFLAVAPFYFGINDAVILRLFRLLRLLKLVKSIKILRASSIFDFENSILRVVSPLILIFVFIKGFIWLLEFRGSWLIETDFDTLFTIIGFALGVVLSQKIGRSYAKYVSVQNDIYTLHGRLMSLQENLNTMSPGKGDELIKNWLRGFLETYNGQREGSVTATRNYNRELYQEASKIGNTELIPFHRLAAMMQGVFEIAISIQSRRTNQTPVAYNVLLQQTTIMYLVLLVLFIPGMKGMISVVFAGYLLYGMYQITNDFDDVIGEHDEDGSTNLIKMDAARIRNYLKELEG